jgi:hypothetical protein
MFSNLFGRNSNNPSVVESNVGIDPIEETDID